MVTLNGLVLFFGLYVVLLNIVASYRLLHDEVYTPVQKTVQLLFVWLVQLVGAATVSYFLNLLPKPAEKWWQRHWLSTGLLSLLLHIRYAPVKPDGYPSSMNDYGPDVAGWCGNEYCGDGFGGDGACGGGGE
jgi:hypothetical protein